MLKFQRKLWHSETSRKWWNWYEKSRFRYENNFWTICFVENRLGDGKKYYWFFGSGVISSKIWFCVFLVENSAIPSLIVTFGDVVKMMKLVRKITFSARKCFSTIFLLENVKGIATAKRWDVAKMMNLVRKITFSAGKRFFYYNFCWKSSGWWENILRIFW